MLKYLNSKILHYTLGLSVDKNDHIVELVNEWFPTVKFINVDAPFSKDSTHEN